jgi:hypothetical protein
MPSKHPFLYIFLGTFIISCSTAFAQNATIDEYLASVGEYAGIYNGQVKSDYNPKLYENNPYHISSEFTDADIIYKGLSFPGQKVLLDLYEEQLILLSPQKHYGIIAESEKVEKIVFKNETFIWLNPSEKSGLSEGFYLLLSDGKQIKLFCKEKFFLDRTNLRLQFKKKLQRYACLNGQYYSVKDKKSFINLFPQHKKQINLFAKGHKLDFKRNADKSLTLLAIYCEELLTSNNHP